MGIGTHVLPGQWLTALGTGGSAADPALGAPVTFDEIASGHSVATGRFWPGVPRARTRSATGARLFWTDWPSRSRSTRPSS